MSTRQKLLWVAALYFAEGLPFGLFENTVPVYLRFQGISLANIGLLSAAGLAWTLKFLWAPAVDRWGSRRTWVWICQALMMVPLTVLAVLDPVQIPWALWGTLVVLVLLSATQDIAIDAYSIELLQKKELGVANGVRVMAYRVALIGTSGLLIAAAGWTGWSMVFISAALLIGGFALVSRRAPSLEASRAPEPLRKPQSLREAILEPVHQFLQRPGFLAVALFILTFKLGDMALGPMVNPFWVDRAFTPGQIGFIRTLAGIVTIGGAVLGGVLTSRWGIFRSLWILGILQAVSNLAYVAAAAIPTAPELMYIASIVESFCGGLGTAPFLAFLMSICDKGHAATQYALLSALFGLTRALSGAFSGIATEQLGYTAYFTATFFLAWPAFLLLPWVKVWAGDGREDK